MPTRWVPRVRKPNNSFQCVGKTVADYGKEPAMYNSISTILNPKKGNPYNLDVSIVFVSLINCDCIMNFVGVFFILFESLIAVGTIKSETLYEV